MSKKPDLNLEGVDVHLIGHLQTNKVKQVVGEVSTIQSVDSVKVAKEISKDQSLIKELKDYLRFNRRFDHNNRFNFQMTDLQAAIGSAVMEELKRKSIH